MADINPARVDIWRRRFARKYKDNLAGLKTLSDSLAVEAEDVVTLTNFNEDGQAGGGQVTGNKMEMLAAAEDVIAEMDDTAPVARARGLVMSFGP